VVIKTMSPNQIVFLSWFLEIKNEIVRTAKLMNVMTRELYKEMVAKCAIIIPTLKQRVSFKIVKLSNFIS
jgi:hypothetical protein